MKLIWSDSALKQLEEIAAYIAEDNPDATARIAGRIVSASERLVLMPRSGRTGKLADTRELPVPGTPYIVVYGVKQDAVEIIGIWHGARDWPKSI